MSMTKLAFPLLLTFAVTFSAAGQKNKKFYDTLGNETTFESHWSMVVGGRYKSTSDRKTNAKILVRTTDKEFKEELQKTEKRVTKKEKVGTQFPDFIMTDVDGDTIKLKDLIGKVVVINFWFIGCSPCEMERPELNGLAQLYQTNGDVVFLSFAKNSAAQLQSFLVDHPFKFKPIPTGDGEIKNRFGVDSYPVTVVVDRNGKYSFYASATGIGISYILKREIDLALSR